MDNLTDNELMLMFQYGDYEAFSILFEKYKEQMWRYIYRLCNDQHLAEDLLQEVFIKIVNSANSYKFEGKLICWFYKIATNHYINYKNSQMAKYKANVVFMPKIKDESQSTLNLIENEEFQQIIKEEIDLMPKRYKEVYVLYEIEEKKYEEIAEILEMPIGTVKIQLHRARKYLLDKIKDYVEI